MRFSSALLITALAMALAACDQTVQAGGSSGSTGTTSSAGTGTTGSTRQGGSTGSSTSAAGSSSSNGSSASSGSSSSSSSASSGSSSGASTGSTTASTGTGSSSGTTTAGSTSTGGSSGTSGALDGGFDYGTGDWRIVSSMDHANIRSLWGDAPDDFWACSSEGGLLRWDGQDWVLTATRNPLPGRGFSHIQGSAADDVWAQGDDYGLMGHFDGSAWTFTTLDAGAADGGADLVGDALWVKGRNDVWIAGRYSVGTSPSTARAFQFDGTRWGEMAGVPNADPPYLAGTSDPAGELWLFGGVVTGSTLAGNAWRYSGGTFNAVLTSSTTFDPQAAWVFGADDAWLTNEVVVKHWDGTQLVQDSPSMTGNNPFVSVLWGQGSTVWALGSGAYRHDDGGWQQLPTYLGSETLLAAWGSSNQDLWTCGADYATGGCSHFDGTAFTPVTIGTAYGIAALYPAPDGTVWTADQNGATFERNLSGHWVDQPAIPGNSGQPDVVALWGTSATDLRAVGNSGMVFHFDGASWTLERPSSSGEAPADMWGSSDTDIWMVGSANGTAPVLVHRDATGWSTVNLSGFGELGAVLGFAADDVWIAGGTGTGSRILHNTGSGFVDWPNLPSGLTLRALAGTSSSDLWAGGDGATLMHFDGSAWTVQAVPFTQDITALAVLNGDLWAATVESSGSASLWRRSGGTWTRDASLPWRVNRMVSQSGGVWAVGEHGLIARYH